MFTALDEPQLRRIHVHMFIRIPDGPWLASNSGDVELLTASAQS
jgi:hypothetical protein